MFGAWDKLSRKARLVVGDITQHLEIKQYADVATATCGFAPVA